MGCFAAVVLTVSCTSDNLEETKNSTNKNNPENFSTSATDSLDVPNSILLDIGRDDKDKVRG